jgi:hypothetical protein
MMLVVPTTAGLLWLIVIVFVLAGERCRVVAPAAAARMHNGEVGLAGLGGLRAAPHLDLASGQRRVLCVTVLLSLLVVVIARGRVVAVVV